MELVSNKITSCGTLGRLRRLLVIITVLCLISFHSAGAHPSSEVMQIAQKLRKIDPDWSLSRVRHLSDLESLYRSYEQHRLSRNINGVDINRNTSQLSHAGKSTIDAEDHKIGKRVFLMRRIHVRIYFHCDISGEGHEDFQWAVVWGSRDSQMRFIPELHIDLFPKADQHYDDNTDPATFRGSFFHDDHNQAISEPADDCCCRHTFF